MSGNTNQLQNKLEIQNEFEPDHPDFQSQCEYIFSRGFNKGSQCPKNATVRNEVGNFCSACSKKKSVQPVSYQAEFIDDALDQLSNRILHFPFKVNTQQLLSDNIISDPLKSNMHSAMLKRIVARKILDVAETMYKDAATDLERFGAQLDLNLDISPGESSQEYSDGVFTFKKRLTKATDIVKLENFNFELIKLGVSPFILEEAKSKATEQRSPAKYLDVTY